MGYRSLKYWHSLIEGGKALEAVTAYSMYLEVTESQLDYLLKVTRILEFVSSNTLQDKKKGKTTKEDSRHDITVDKLKRACYTRHRSGRLCGDLGLFQNHVNSKGCTKNLESCK
eukprot:7913582-Ditylum_brightwellii.AAC.1